MVFGIILHKLNKTVGMIQTTLENKRNVDMFMYINIQETKMKTEYAKELPAEWNGFSSLFIALGDPHRQRILLAFDKDEKLTAGQIASLSPLNRTTISHHLKVLKQAGVLHSEKKGTEVFYWVERKYIRDSLTAVLNFIED